jgi:hypothetical protein
MAEIRSQKRNCKNVLKQQLSLNNETFKVFSYIHVVIREPVAVHDTASTNFRYDQMSLATNHT